MKVHLQSVHFSADKKLVQLIQKKLDRLEKYFDRINEANVRLKLENSGQVRDKIIEIKLSLPRTTLFVRENRKTFEAAVDQAVATLKRQLLKHKERSQSKQLS